MNNLLTDRLIRVETINGAPTRMSLPEVYAALKANRVKAFPSLRPHQRHAWHAFLAQLAVMAMQHAGEPAPPETASRWLSLLRHMTQQFVLDEPWLLVADDPEQPGFMQCPAPNGLDEYRGRATTPGDLDVVVTSKNHRVKQSAAGDGAFDAWMFALISVQTMGGFLGAGNYGIARMNGGFSTRPCLGLAPEGDGSETGRRPGRPGAHLFHDIGRMIVTRAEMKRDHPAYDYDDGRRLLWLDPWDGATQLELRDLDPYFIEICRRIRLVRSGTDGLSARTATSKRTRIVASEARGNLGDFWTPTDANDGKALSLAVGGFRYDRLAKMLFDSGSYTLPRAARVEASPGKRWRVIARGAVGGQGKTEAYYERTDVLFGGKTARKLGSNAGRDELAEIMKAQLAEVAEITKALKFGIAVAASGGKPANEIKKADRQHAGPYVRRLDDAVDGLFFAAHERRYEAKDEAEKRAARAGFAGHVRAKAMELLDEAIETVPQPTVRRHRSRVRAEAAFNGFLKRTSGVFSDQPEIVGKDGGQRA